MLFAWRQAFVRKTARGNTDVMACCDGAHPCSSSRVRVQLDPYPPRQTAVRYCAGECAEPLVLGAVGGLHFGHSLAAALPLSQKAFAKYQM